MTANEKLILFIESHNDFTKIILSSFEEKTLYWAFSFNQSAVQKFKCEIKYDGHQTYSYRCNCDHKGPRPICGHIKAIFDKYSYGDPSGFFLKYKDWTYEKNKLLEPYGITISDKETEAFQFTVSSYGELSMTAPPSYIRTSDREYFNKMRNLLKPSYEENSFRERPQPLPGTIIDFETGFVINLTGQRLKTGFELEPVKVYRKKDKIDVRKFSLNQSANLPLLKELSDDVYDLLLSLSDTALVDYLRTQGHNYLSHLNNPWPKASDDTLRLLKKHYIEVLQKIWPFIAAHPAVFLLKEGNFSSSNCKPVSISKEMIELSFAVEIDGRFITIKLLQDDGEVIHGFIFQKGNSLHIIKNIADLAVIELFKTGFIKIPVSSKLEAIQNIIAPLQQRYPVSLPENLKVHTLTITPSHQVLFKEHNNQYLMMQPRFMYEETVMDYNPRAQDLVSSLSDGSIQVIKRDVSAEKHFFETLRSLHKLFQGQKQNDFFYLPFEQVMEDNWFLHTVRYLQENNVVVKGMGDLKRFRYNTNKPKWEMKAGSGIDWFDFSVTISFGDQEVPLKDVRKAILSKQNMVVLRDGTFGILPAEWIEQYGMLLKMGVEQQDGHLRLSKLHFTLIDELHDQMDDEDILQEIEVKKQKLKGIENIQTLSISKEIKATLRPYQLSGFQWMQTLSELGWGGCLGDDMGLGKTLQTITFFQYLKETHPGSTHLVVCPTSLIYNWEDELQKFAPKLKYHIYYGTARECTDEHFENYDVIITSYGLVRIDMEQLLKFKWHYVVLDENQAIKNTDAQTTKAVQLLKAKNRLILSGTPVQNNTFDLYAQFHFLNPGLLGSKEFFKQEFATPIDKYNDADKSSQLKKLVYPFLLRRTKEQVAKDLPDKTETILWCELAKVQRSVYEDYKNYYKKMLMQKIAEEGMAKAGMHILEGLLRLRQICDSPQLLKDAEVTTTQSIKTEELLREIEENTGSHKLLVFSQFTEMLSLIALKLKEKHITYCYLDGSTPAAKRKEQVNMFQNDQAIKVFLISLKAGGVGLNLTAADYVYIVDPWWNPATEQQAIDRTHRIGQTKKVFAYKMICKDTVEEKILGLQKRKRQLANDLVTEDAGFIKKLTKEDVAFLFS